MQYLFIVIVEKMVVFAAVVIRNDSIEVDILDTSENVHIHGRICLSQTAEKLLDFAPF